MLYLAADADKNEMQFLLNAGPSVGCSAINEYWEPEFLHLSLVGKHNFLHLSK